MAIKKHEDPEPKSGQLMRPNPPLPLAARTAKVRTLDRLLSMLSVWPFRNRAFAESLETATNVIKKQTELEETIIGHGKTRAKLNDLGTIIAQDKLQRHNAGERLAEEALVMLAPYRFVRLITLEEGEQPTDVGTAKLHVTLPVV